MITRATFLFFILTLILIVSLDFPIKNFDYKKVMSDLFDFSKNPGNIYLLGIVGIALIYSFITDLRLKRSSSHSNGKKKNNKNSST